MGWGSKHAGCSTTAWQRMPAALPACQHKCAGHRPKPGGQPGGCPTTPTHPCPHRKSSAAPAPPAGACPWSWRPCGPGDTPGERRRAHPAWPPPARTTGPSARRGLCAAQQSTPASQPETRLCVLPRPGWPCHARHPASDGIQPPLVFQPGHPAATAGPSLYQPHLRVVEVLSELVAVGGQAACGAVHSLCHLQPCQSVHAVGHLLGLWARRQGVRVEMDEAGNGRAAKG